MASALIDDESEGARTLQHSEGDEIHSPPPSHWSEPMYLFLMSRGPPKVRKTVDWLYGRDTTLGMPKPWLRLPSTKGPISLEPLWIRWTRPFTSPILLATLIAAYIVSCVYESWFIRCFSYAQVGSRFSLGPNGIKRRSTIGPIAHPRFGRVMMSVVSTAISAARSIHPIPFNFAVQRGAQVLHWLIIELSAT